MSADPPPIAAGPRRVRGRGRLTSPREDNNGQTAREAAHEEKAMKSVGCGVDQLPVRMPEVKEYVLAGGSETSGIPTEEARAKVRSEIAMWAKVVKAAGIKVE